MLPFWFQKHVSLKNCSTATCATLTLLLIYQELVTFTITKPTTTSKGERKLDISDLPEVVICLVPAFHTGIMHKYNFPPTKYFKGVNKNDKFVGWNGKGAKNKSAQDILDEILTFDNQSMYIGGGLVHTLYYKEEHIDHVPAKVKPKTLAYPYGRCMSITPPPPQKNTSYKDLNSLYLKLNDNPYFRNKTLRVFFMEQVNSLQLYPNEMEMIGDPIEIKLEHFQHWKASYKTKISRSQHVQNDPNFKCGVYTGENSYNDCVQNELLELFNKEIGCHPPLLAKESKHMCNKNFDVTNTKAARINKLFKHLYYHDGVFKCMSPCSSIVYNTRFVHKAEDKRTHLVITFDKTVEVIRSTFSIDEQTFLSRLGGSVSSGRTLLWMILTLVGVIQVVIQS